MDAQHCKKAINYRSVRVAKEHRVVAIEMKNGCYGSELELTLNMISC